jgi:hypothetical protein
VRWLGCDDCWPIGDDGALPLERVSGPGKAATRPLSAPEVKALSGIQRPAQLKLDRFEAATALRDRAALPGNRFEKLGGDRRGQFHG